MNRILLKQEHEILRAIQDDNLDSRCPFFHNGLTCNERVFHVIMGVLTSPKILKMYTLIHLIPFIIFKRKQLKSKPKKAIIHFVIGFIKSLLFASLASGLSVRIYCLLLNHTNLQQLSFMAASFLGGAAVMMESIGRQQEIVYYCTSKSLEVLYQMALRRKLPVRVPMGECVLNAACIAFISFVYFDNQEAIPSKYRTVVGFFMKDI